jgi:hypothetical protein
MKTILKLTVIIIFGIAITATFSYIINTASSEIFEDEIPKASASQSTDIFAKCLANKGMKMYGTEWCKNCQKQKALFGDSFKYIPEAG